MNKKQMVLRYQNGKKRADIVAQYDLTKSALNKWVKQYQPTDSFIAQSNCSAMENELIALYKKISALLMRE